MESMSNNDDFIIAHISSADIPATWQEKKI